MIRTDHAGSCLGRREYALEDLEKVAKCAYFDYQREKVFVRTHPHLKVVNKKHRKFRRTSIRVNEVRLRKRRCPRCRSKKIDKGKHNKPRSDRSEVLQGWGKEVDYSHCVLEIPLLQMSAPVQFQEHSPYPQKYGHGIAELVRLLQCRLRFEHAAEWLKTLGMSLAFDCTRTKPTG